MGSLTNWPHQSLGPAIRLPVLNLATGKDTCKGQFKSNKIDVWANKEGT